jgi:predicted nucleic acid-binding protein
MSRIYWDTMLFVYWLEGHPEHSRRVQTIFEKMQTRGDILYTSTFTLGEVLTGPRRHGNDAMAVEIKSFFHSSTVELIPFAASAAERFAEIRGRNRVSPADAIHLACAADAGTDLFLTNDHALEKLVIPGIDFIAAMDVGLF